MASRRPVYQVIYDDLVDRISRGTLRTGDRIPTEMEWAHSYGVSRITARNALDRAARDGIIERFPRKGSFVSSRASVVISRRTSIVHRTIGVIQPDFSDSFGLEFFRSLQTRAQQREILTTTGISSDDPEIENRLIGDFLDAGVEALVIKPVHNETFNDKVLRLIIDGFPIVLVDRYLRDVSCANVVSNNSRAAAEAMQHLYSLGHRRIGIFSRPIGSTTTLIEREKGVMHAVTESGAPFRPQWFLRDLPDDTDTNPRHAREVHDRIRDFLIVNRDITAVFALKHTFVPIIEWVAAELGRQIPDDLSVVSFDAPRGHANRPRPLTHLRQNEDEMARQALEAIVSAIEGAPDRSARLVDVELVLGQSTAQPRE